MSGWTKMDSGVNVSSSLRINAVIKKQGLRDDNFPKFALLARALVRIESEIFLNPQCSEPIHSIQHHIVLVVFLSLTMPQIFGGSE